MVEKGMTWIIGIIIAIVVVVIVAFFVISNSNSLINSFLNKIGLGSSSQQTKDQATLQFSDFKNTINNCISNQKSECFCTNQKILFPTGYRVEFTDDTNLNLHIALLTEKKDNLANFDLQVPGCNIIKRINEPIPFGQTLDLVYGQKPVINYESSNFEFMPDYVFYKKQGQLCVVEKAMVSTLNTNSVC